jgi:hypothetical protein
MEQIDPHLSLKLADMIADRRSGCLELSRCRSEAAEPSCGFEGANGDK